MYLHFDLSSPKLNFSLLETPLAFADHLPQP